MSTYDFVAQPVLARPLISLAEAQQVASAQFGVSGEFRELASNQERNYLITTPTGRFVLKIANSAFSDDEVEVQNAALLHLAQADPELLIPRPHFALAGGTVARFHADGRELRARLLDFIPGFPLSDVVYLAPVVVARLGELVARISAGLVNFQHRGLSRNLQWDIRRSRAVGSMLLAHVDDPARVDILRSALERACDGLDALAADLRIQPVHGDASDDNVVCGRERNGRAVPNGVIDFGDVSDSWVVGELAATCASVLAHDPGRPLSVLPAVRAFHQLHPLTEPEVAALWPAIIARTAVLVTSGIHQARTDPGNHYAIGNQRREWQMFESANAIPAQVAHSAIRSAIGIAGRFGATPRPPTPTTHRLLPSLTDSEMTVLDLSPLSGSLHYGGWLEPDAEADLARAALNRTSAAVARYGQARLTRTRVDHQADPPTVALGIEVFCASGIAVLAPFAGTLTANDTDTAVITGDGIELTLTGVDISADIGESVAAGSALGSVGVTRDTLGGPPGRVFVQLCTAPGLHPPRFVAASLAPHWAVVCPDPSELLGFGGPAPNALSGAEVLNIRARAVAPVQEHYYRTPPRIERGWRHHLIDINGRTYLDMINNVASVGHAHPRITHAASRQLDLLNTNSRFNYLAVAAFSRRLADLLPDPLEVVFLVNSGSEAVDLALRLARTFTDREDVVCIAEGYHGWTLGSDAVSTSLQDNPRALTTRPAWVHAVPAPNEFRGQFRGPDIDGRYAEQARQIIAATIEANRPPAAFICEAFYGNAGAVALPDRYLATVYEAIRASGGLCIADEVQVGYGRLGQYFWGFEQQQVVPDIVTIAKAIGNGHPLGAVITRRDIADSFASDGYFFSSAGGSPVSCEVGLTVLDVIEEEGLQHNAAVVGDHLASSLRELAKSHPLIGAVHGLGLYLGIEFVRDRDTLEPATEETEAICERLLDLGVIVQPTGDHLNVLKIKPPLCLTTESADFFLGTLHEVLRTGW